MLQDQIQSEESQKNALESARRNQNSQYELVVAKLENQMEQLQAKCERKRQKL